MSKSTFKILFYLRKNQVNKDGTVCIMIIENFIGTFEKAQ